MTDSPDGHPLDPVLLRGLTQRRFSRRSMLQLTGAAGGVAMLSACGVKGQAKKTNTSKSAVQKFWAGKKKHGRFVFANWPLYIDVSDKNKDDHPSIDEFTKKTGIAVTYKEVIQDDDSFFGKVQPVLAAGQSTGYDMIVITNGLYLTKLIELGYLEPLDHSKLPNFFKYAAKAYINPSYDKNNTYSVPWQSGITGIAWNPKYIKRPITSYEDLFDPAYKGKVGMFGDTEDLPNLAMVGLGINCETSTVSDWKKAAGKLNEQKRAGLVRKYYEQDYIDPLTKGDIWISMAWSGDVFQQNASAGSNLQFTVPKEGGVLWTDNMLIPKGAANPVDAITYMDYVYQPEVAAQIADYVNYITPVPDVKAVFQQDASSATSAADKSSYQTLATSKLIFPSNSDYQRLHRYRVLSPSEEKTWDSIFQPVYQS